MKLQTIYICTKCNAQSSRWSGQCFKCKAWNTLVEDVVNVGKQQKRINITIQKPILLSAVSQIGDNRLKTGIGELDRVLGGGFMVDGITLLVGDPGIGKSTLTLQICDRIAGLDKKVIYFSGEESVEQIAGRAHRLQLKNQITATNGCHLESVLEIIKNEKPDFIVLDSVQVMASEALESHAGSISQVRYVAEQMMHVAKEQKIPVLLIGHVTKDGQLAGPQVLTHLVDAVLYLEGDGQHEYRLLRSTKNRFGTVDEVGVFNMEEKGLLEVKNPSALFLDGRSKEAIGSAIVPVLEGTRVFLVEVQALTQYTQFGYPKRTASGFDLNRLNIIIATLNRHANLKLDSCDVFVNIVGGLKLKEPAVDLAVAMAIASSKLKKPLPSDLAIMGEVGLSGEVRKISQLERRKKEAKKMGFEKILSSSEIKVIAEAMKRLA